MVRKFSDGPVEDIDDDNQELKCYLHCVFETLEIYDLEKMFEGETKLFTDEEIAVLEDMEAKCQPYDYEMLKKEQCEYAYELNKCWKLANPEVDKLNCYIFTVNAYFYSFLSITSCCDCAGIFRRDHKEDIVIKFPSNKS